jgi:hypothetical protein
LRVVLTIGSAGPILVNRIRGSDQFLLNGSLVLSPRWARQRAQNGARGAQAPGRTGSLRPTPGEPLAHHPIKNPSRFSTCTRPRRVAKTRQPLLNEKPDWESGLLVCSPFGQLNQLLSRGKRECVRALRRAKGDAAHEKRCSPESVVTKARCELPMMSLSLCHLQIPWP